jgi:hypothetical protein
MKIIFHVWTLMQRVAVMEEIVSLQPQLERAINNGDVARYASGHL